MKPYNINPIEKTFGYGRSKFSTTVIELGEKGLNRDYALVYVSNPSENYKIQLRSGGNVSLLPSESDHNGWVVRVSSKNHEDGEKAKNHFACIEGSEGVIRLAMGEGRYGEDGRGGGYEDSLLYVPYGAIVRVLPSNVKHKVENYYYLLFNKDEVLRFSKEELEKYLIDNHLIGTSLEFPLFERIKHQLKPTYKTILHLVH